MIGQVVLEVLYEVVGEVLVQGVGYLLVSTFRRDVKSEDTICTVVGLCFWIVVLVAALAYGFAT
jgi:hypothetical protein